MSEFKRISRKGVFDLLKHYDVTAGDDAFIEITEWHNGIGFDVEICGNLSTRFQMTYDTFNALKILVEKLESLEY